MYFAIPSSTTGRWLGHNDPRAIKGAFELVSICSGKSVQLRTTFRIREIGR